VARGTIPLNNQNKFRVHLGDELEAGSISFLERDNNVSHFATATPVCKANLIDSSKEPHYSASDFVSALPARTWSRTMKNVATWVLVMLVALMVCLQAIQYRRIQQRNDQLVRILQTRDRPASDHLKPGDAVPTAAVLNKTGVPRNLDVSGDKLLFVYSAHCSFCKRNFPNWLHLEAASRIKPTYVSVDSVAEAAQFAEEQGFDTLVFATPEDKSRLKITAVPQTIRIHAGRVEQIYVGVLSEQQQIALNANFPSDGSTPVKGERQ
jgi:hypothetical protein